MYINRSDEDDPSGSKYTRMEEESIQDKERFARLERASERLSAHAVINTRIVRGEGRVWQSDTFVPGPRIEPRILSTEV
uniref:Uncharacterized protein n=1 Tax=Timema bartmani TaxID=61472 RepID=A0A7R9HVS6_9NEOP|nr:unnamed protein product [Timema bartmani]